MLGLPVEVMEKLDYLSKVLDRKKSNLVQEFVTNLFQVLCTFEKGNVEYETHVSSSMVTIYVKASGRNRLVSGTRPVKGDENE